MRQKPTILAREIVATSRLFCVEELKLRFSNGVERTYERLVGKGAGYGAVMIVAMLDSDHAVLVEEYCGGTDEYEMSLPKGLIEPGEDVLAAAERELKEEAGYKVKRITVKPGESLSLQYHHQRAEHWVVVQGIGLVQVGDKEMRTEPGQYRYIPLKERHRLTNIGKDELVLIEVQCGNYLGEDDIVRLADTYGRA